MKLLNWILGLGSSAVLVMVILQCRTVADLRAESTRLAVATNVAIAPNSNPSELDATELARLREENRDLLKLRNEAQQLRQQLKESASLQSQNDRLREMAATKVAPASATQPREGFTTKAALADVGAATPEAALQTYFWTMREGNLERFLQFLPPQMGVKVIRRQAKPEQWAEMMQNVQQVMKEQMDMFSDFRIVGKSEVDVGHVLMRIQSSASERVAVIGLIQAENEWKIADPPFK